MTSIYHKLSQSRKILLGEKSDQLISSGFLGICALLSIRHLLLRRVARVFQTNNTSLGKLGKFWRALDWKMMIYYMAIWNILQEFGICYNHLVHFVYFFTVLVSCTNKNLATLQLCAKTLLQKIKSMTLEDLAVAFPNLFLFIQTTYTLENFTTVFLLLI
jgi:hypothetical protein